MWDVGLLLQETNLNRCIIYYNSLCHCMLVVRDRINVKQGYMCLLCSLLVCHKIPSLQTSPKAHLPIIVSSSKSSTQILWLLSRTYSVFFLSRSFIKLICCCLGNLRRSELSLQEHQGKEKERRGKKIWPLISTVPYHMKGLDMATAYLAV
jgi:hypothetical protein